jgi:predicted metal-dependent phosphoesterase TrpH
MTQMLRADLHVHTRYSSVNGILPFLGSRDCYSTPQDVYAVAKSRGMDLVAFTDHDSIDGALEFLASHPDADDVIVGEEVSCRLPGADMQVHLGVYGMTESLHRDVQALRANVFDVIARLRQADVFFSLNHLLHFYRRQIPLGAYLQLLDEVPALEVRNGTMLAAHNTLVERMAARPIGSGALPRLAMVAGSDAHTLRRVGLTWTVAPGRTRDEFLSSLRQGLARPGGRHGTTATVAGDAYGVVAEYLKTLAGLRPPDHRSWRRASLLAFAVVSLPFQFLPFALAAAAKRGERREVERAWAEMTSTTEPVPAAALSAESRA